MDKKMGDVEVKDLGSVNKALCPSGVGVLP